MSRSLLRPRGPTKARTGEARPPPRSRTVAACSRCRQALLQAPPARIALAPRRRTLQATPDGGPSPGFDPLSRKEADDEQQQPRGDVPEAERSIGVK
jgi:hypothetical protein